MHIFAQSLQYQCRFRIRFGKLRHDSRQWMQLDSDPRPNLDSIQQQQRRQRHSQLHLRHQPRRKFEVGDNHGGWSDFYYKPVRPVSAFETPRINLQPHARIDDHPCRIAPNNTPHVEHRIVRHCRSNPHDDGIHRSPEPVHMIERRLAVNPPAFPRRSRNPPIERLP